MISVTDWSRRSPIGDPTQEAVEEEVSDVQESLDAVHEIVSCILAAPDARASVQTSGPTLADWSAARQACLAWRLSGGLFAPVQADELSDVRSTDDLARLVGPRQQKNLAGDTAADLFELVRRAVRRFIRDAEAPVGWDTNIEVVIRKARKRRWSLRLADWGADDIINELDLLRPNQPDYLYAPGRVRAGFPIVLGAMAEFGLVSSFVNYLWRFHASQVRLVPRCEWAWRSGLNAAAKRPHIAEGLQRLLVVMLDTNITSIDDGTELQDVFQAVRQVRGAADNMLVRWRRLLDLELRVCGINIHSQMHRRFFGNIAGYGLPKRIRTFGNLCDAVMRNV